MRGIKRGKQLEVEEDTFLSSRGKDEEEEKDGKEKGEAILNDGEEEEVDERDEEKKSSPLLPPPKTLSPPSSPSTSAAAAVANRYKKVGGRSRRNRLKANKNVNKKNAKRADKLLAQLENLNEEVVRIQDQVGKVKRPGTKTMQNKNDWDRLLLGGKGKGGVGRNLEEIKMKFNPDIAMKIVNKR